jgi:O-antigen ligase
MGRMSATVIVPNMIKSQYVQGIGWGNYPLTRNNPAYREFMPEIPVSMWDATGLGGILDMLLEAGIIFFVFYMALYARIIMIIKKNLSQSNYLILALIGPLVLGVAIYFFYTWFLLGMLLFCFYQISGKEGKDLDGKVITL